VGRSAAIRASACAFRLCDSPVFPGCQMEWVANPRSRRARRHHQVCRRPPFCARRKPAAGLIAMARSHEAGYARETKRVQLFPIEWLRLDPRHRRKFYPIG